MNQQNSPFPLFFTLERVENGYILTAKENTGSLSQEPKFRKEVVAEDKISSRVGQLLNLEAMTKERPLLFHVEAVNEGTYKTESDVPADHVMEAKLAFVHIKSKNIPADTVLVLQLTDIHSIEVCGDKAEKLAKDNGISITRTGGIPVLRLPDNKDGKKLLASFCNRPQLLTTTQKEILQWYNEHKVVMESKAK